MSLSLSDPFIKYDILPVHRSDSWSRVDGWPRAFGRNKKSPSHLISGVFSYRWKTKGTAIMKGLIALAGTLEKFGSLSLDASMGWV